MVLGMEASIHLSCTVNQLFLRGTVPNSGLGKLYHDTSIAAHSSTKVDDQCRKQATDVGQTLTVLAAVDVRPTSLASLSHWAFTSVFSMIQMRQRVAWVYLRQLVVVQLVTASSQVVSVTFQDLSLEQHPRCSYDSVTLYDGSSDSSPQLAKVCTVDPGTVKSTGSSLFIVFESDFSIHTGRFSLSWTFVSGGSQGL